VPPPPGPISGNPGLNTSGFDNSGWNYPGIYNSIAQMGLTIVAENVLIVDANSKWVNTGINVNPGEQIWIDSRANGNWQINQCPVMDANGYPPNTSSLAPYLVDQSASIGELIGCVGTPPSVPPSSGGITSQQFFAVGDTLMNFPVTGTGVVSMQINDNDCHTTSGTGLQEVRIIVTR
jgi:hypothetical protein